MARYNYYFPSVIIAYSTLPSLLCIANTVRWDSLNRDLCPDLIFCHSFQCQSSLTTVIIFNFPWEVAYDSSGVCSQYNIDTCVCVCIIIIMSAWVGGCMVHA